MLCDAKFAILADTIIQFQPVLYRASTSRGSVWPVSTVCIEQRLEHCLPLMQLAVGL